jgi:conjugal transfer pilus assembly protein TraW
VLVASVLVVVAQNEEPADYTRILEHTQAVQREALEHDPPSTIVPVLRDEDLEFARGLLEEATSNAAGATHAHAPADAQQEAHAQRVIYFVSLGMPTLQLVSILQEASGRRDVRVVFRGVRPGATIGAFARQLRALVEELDPIPEVGLDPPLFREYGVQSVPELVLAIGGATYRARGSIGVDDVEKRISQAPEVTDLGRFGPTYDILEPDLITVMQERLAALDVAALKRSAQESYWQRGAEFVELPKAQQDVERTVPTTVEVTADITGPDGTIIARAGEVIDLARYVPLTKWYVVFDATDAGQRAFARDWIARADAAGRGVSLITTRLDVTRGWQGLTELQRELGLPVYLLRRDLVDRFDLRAVPSIMGSDEGGALKVHEYALD